MSKMRNISKNVRSASNDAKQALCIWHSGNSTKRTEKARYHTTNATMSDAEDIAAAAAEEAIAETEEERSRKRKERLEQNRLSARESRKRKKAMIEELQRTVITLSRDNKELNDKNEQLRRQLMDIGTKVRTDVNG